MVPQGKVLFFNPLSVLKAKYQAKSFKGHAKIICFEGDTAIFWLYQITGDGVNKAKPVGYVSVARNWQAYTDWELSWVRKSVHFQILLVFFWFFFLVFAVEESTENSA